MPSQPRRPETAAEARSADPSPRALELDEPLAHRSLLLMAAFLVALAGLWLAVYMGRG